MVVQRISKTLKLALTKIIKPTNYETYRPTPYLNHHILQSAYQLISSDIHIPFNRQKVFFQDGGHVALDWHGQEFAEKGRPIIFIMHGMTGGSQCKYIRALAQTAIQNNYGCVCLNGRGINSQMTSPIPFVGYNFHQLQQALIRVKIHYPNSQIHIIGTSLGGNYVLRYLLKHKVQKVKSLSLISAPFDVKFVIDNMNPLYQRFFIKSYIQNSVCRHEQMKFWWNNKIVDLEHLKQSKNLRDFHQRITTKVTGYEDLDKFFDHFLIKQEELQKFDLDTFILTAKDDPMVAFSTVPIQAINKNNKIKFIATNTGGHLCWFQGLRSPQRWYPKPVFQFINQIDKSTKKQKHHHFL